MYHTLWFWFINQELCISKGTRKILKLPFVFVSIVHRARWWQFCWEVQTVRDENYGIFYEVHSIAARRLLLPALMRICVCVIPLLVLALWQSLLEEMRFSCVTAIEATTRCPSLSPFTVATRFSLYRTLSPPRSSPSINIRVRSCALIACVSFLFLFFLFFPRNHRPKPAAIILVDDSRQSRHHHHRIIASLFSDALSDTKTFPPSWSEDSKDDINYFAARKTRLARRYPWTLMTYALTNI